MPEYLQNIIKSHKAGHSVGVYSVCSANKFVLEASMIHAKKNNNFLLIEATSNQVDQFGGYTGMTPKDFTEMIRSLAAKADYPFESIVLGGDHLGPNVWQNEKSESAMEKAGVQIREYVKAGFGKLHLDTSMACADDKLNPNKMLDADTITSRAARLCKVAEETAIEFGITRKPVYVIGTDVPIPGGALEDLENIRITPPHEVEETISLTHNAYSKYTLDDAWSRTVGVVVQPGVEFSDSTVARYNRSKAKELINKIEEYGNFVYEAHSTDFQTGASLREMVEDHFCILKVGPWLTFAFREAVFSLAAIENELGKLNKSFVPSDIRTVLEEIMKGNPRYWKKHYVGGEQEIEFAKKYSYSDRIRYYWTEKSAEKALARLLENLTVNAIPMNLLSQYLPQEYDAVKEGRISIKPEDLIHSKIMHVLDKYKYAIDGGKK